MIWRGRNGARKRRRVYSAGARRRISSAKTGRRGGRRGRFLRGWEIRLAIFGTTVWLWRGDWTRLIRGRWRCGGGGGREDINCTFSPVSGGGWICTGRGGIDSVGADGWQRLPGRQ